MSLFTDLKEVLTPYANRIKGIGIQKAIIVEGAFNLTSSDKKLVVQERAALAATNGPILFKFLEANTSVSMLNGTQYDDYVHLVFFKISTKTMFVFIPTGVWPDYSSLLSEIKTNPSDYMYLFCIACRNGSFYYCDIGESKAKYLVDSKNWGVSGNLTDFEMFKRDCRITPIVLDLDFNSYSSFTVKRIVLANYVGTADLLTLPNGYTVDWSDLPNPGWNKLLLLNDETRQLEVHQHFDASLILTHRYVGFIYYARVMDTTSMVVEPTRYGIKSTDVYVDDCKRNLYKIPKKVGVIGDSLSVGYMKDASDTVHRRMPEYSWVKNISRDSGNPWLNLGQSGQNVLTWCSDSTYGKVELETAGNKCQMYIIGLGVNDSSGATGRGIPLGSSSNISTNPDTVATTYYGGYARIIQLIKRVNPNAIIICLTNPAANATGETYNEAVRYIANTYYSSDNTVLLLDLYSKHKLLYTDTDSYVYVDRTRPMAGGHLTSYGYTMVATLMERDLNDLIFSNRATFENLPFIEYDAVEQSGAEGTLSDDLKRALLDCFNHVGWSNTDGSSYMESLIAALGGSPLPNGYKRYDYITKELSAGTQARPKSQWILLDEFENLNAYNYEFDFGITEGGAASGNAIFGGRLQNATNSLAFYATVADDGSLAVHCHGKDHGFLQKGVVNIDGKNHCSFVNGDDFSTYSVNSSTPSMLEWGENAAINTQLSVLGNWSKSMENSNQGIGLGGQCGEIVIKSNATVIADYIPCVRTSDNIIGMYDTVASRFHTATDLTAVTNGGSSAVYKVGMW